MRFESGPVDVVPVGEARAALTQTLRAFRAEPESSPVVLGAHRTPDAVLIPFAQYRRLVEASVSDEPAADASPARAALSRHRTLIERLARANRVVDVKVFGSVARGDDGPDSDIDLLVEPADDASLFDLAQLEIDLEDLLGRPVDVVSRRALVAGRDDAILREAIAL
jgi:uncharacterized protein